MSKENVSGLWRDVKNDLAEKSSAGYRMALIDADKVLRLVMKKNGYPGKNLEQQLFWSGVRFEGKNDLKRALEKKEEIISASSYQLSTLEIDDYINAYGRAIEAIEKQGNLNLKQKIYFFFEKNFSRQIKKILKIILTVFLFYLFGVKFLTSTVTGRNIVIKLVDGNNFLFTWIINLIIFALVIAVLCIIIFLWLDRKRRVKIKDDHSIKGDF